MGRLAFRQDVLCGQVKMSDCDLVPGPAKRFFKTFGARQLRQRDDLERCLQTGFQLTHPVVQAKRFRSAESCNLQPVARIRFTCEPLTSEGNLVPEGKTCGAGPAVGAESQRNIGLQVSRKRRLADIEGSVGAWTEHNMAAGLLELGDISSIDLNAVYDQVRGFQATLATKGRDGAATRRRARRGVPPCQSVKFLGNRTAAVHQEVTFIR